MSYDFCPENSKEFFPLLLDSVSMGFKEAGTLIRFHWKC